MNSLLSPRINSLRQLPFVALVIVVCTVVFLTLFFSNLDAIAWWFMPDNAQELWTPGGIWQLWTPIFVHYTLLHLLTNLYLWWMFAVPIEQQSRVELIVLALIAAAISNACQYLAAGARFGGLSGVVYALLGYVAVEYYLAKMPRFKLDPVLALLMLIMLPLAATGVLGKFANYAHMSGLLCGILCAGLRLILLQQVTCHRIRLFP